MRTRFGNTRLSVHPLLPILWTVLFLAGHGSGVLSAVLALCVHESGHILAARCFRRQIESVEITPLGGILSLRGPDTLSPAQTLLIAAAGPLFSFLGCLAAPILYEKGIFSFMLTGAFIRNSALLFLINMLPALPLDGGKMAQGICGLLFPRVKPYRVLCILGAAAGTALCLATLVFAFRGHLILGPLFAGLYLFYSASVEHRQEPFRYVTSLIDRRQKIDQDDVLPVQLLAAGGSVPAVKILKSLSPGKYHLFLVLSPDGTKPIGFVEESAYCDSILSNKNQTLGEIGRSSLIKCNNKPDSI